jgi:hypothetical protein
VPALHPVLDTLDAPRADLIGRTGADVVVAQAQITRLER